jgi:hypothetical protein
MTVNDHDYIIAIRSFANPSPDQAIDTPAEVCSLMREEDFAHKYVLNVSLIDHLLEKERRGPKLKSALRYISENFADAEEFLTAYFISGRHLNLFIRELSNEWPQFAFTALSSSKSAEIISYILKFADGKYIVESMNAENTLGSYLSESGSQVFASNLEAPSEFDVLKSLEVTFLNLESLGANSQLVDYAHENDLYKINPQNILYLLNKYRNKDGGISIDFKRANYTAITTTGSNPLQAYVELNLPDYVDNILLTLAENTLEAEPAILSLLKKRQLK